MKATLGSLTLYSLIFLFATTFAISLTTAFADQAIEDMVNQSLASTQGNLKNQNSSEQTAHKFIPSYSEGKSEGDRMNKKSDADLKNEGEYIVKNGKNGNDGAAITLKAMEIKPVEGFENHSMFKRAEAIWDNPIELVNNLTEEDCKETVNTESQQWSKRITMEKKFEEDIEKRTCDVKTILKDTHCEAPAPKIKCEEMLSVHCQRETKEFKELKNIKFNTQNCITKDEEFTFHISDIKQIKEFKLMEIWFGDAFDIKINGISVKSDSARRNVNCYEKETRECLNARDSSDSTGMCFYSSETICSPSCTNGGDYRKDSNRLKLQKDQINLMPYLKNGNNKITIRANTSGSIAIDATESYCNFKETWSKRCHE